MSEQRANEIWLMMGVVARSYPEIQWVAGVEDGRLKLSLSRFVNGMLYVEARLWTIAELELRIEVFYFHDELAAMTRRLRTTMAERLWGRL